MNGKMARPNAHLKLPVQARTLNKRRLLMTGGNRRSDGYCCRQPSCGAKLSSQPAPATHQGAPHQCQQGRGDSEPAEAEGSAATCPADSDDRDNTKIRSISATGSSIFQT
jgi:hypothetical protein